MYSQHENVVQATEFCRIRSMTSAKHVSEDFIILFHPSARTAPDTGKTFSGRVRSEKPTDGAIHIKKKFWTHNLQRVGGKRFRAGKKKRR